MFWAQLLKLQRNRSKPSRSNDEKKQNRIGYHPDAIQQHPKVMLSSKVISPARAAVIGDSNSMAPLFFGHGKNRYTRCISLNSRTVFTAKRRLIPRQKTQIYKINNRCYLSPADLRRLLWRNQIRLIYRGWNLSPNYLKHVNHSFILTTGRNCISVITTGIISLVVTTGSYAIIRISNKTGGVITANNYTALTHLKRKLSKMLNNIIPPAPVATPTAPAFKCGISTSFDDFKRRYPTGKRSDWHTAKAAAKRNLSSSAAHKAAIARNWAMNMDYIQGGAA